jgi:uncharacterized membrane protein
MWRLDCIPVPEEQGEHAESTSALPSLVLALCRMDEQEAWVTCPATRWDCPHLSTRIYDPGTNLTLFRIIHQQASCHVDTPIANILANTLYGYCTGHTQTHTHTGEGKGMLIRAVLCSELFINQDLEQTKTGGLLLMECRRLGSLVK